MKLSIKQLRSLIQETLYSAWSPKHGKDKSVDVEADNTKLAGDLASDELFDKYGIKVDPMTIDVTPKPIPGQAPAGTAIIERTSDDMIKFTPPLSTSSIDFTTEDMLSNIMKDLLVKHDVKFVDSRFGFKHTVYDWLKDGVYPVDHWFEWFKSNCDS
mgnify:CR=1 FL=1